MPTNPSQSSKRSKDATGFSRDVCAILLIANITRCFFWIGKHFEIALLVQSIFMILAQLALLYICILYRPRSSPETLGVSTRPLSFWQWPTYTQYIEFLAGLILCQAILFLIFGRSEVFVGFLGFVALGLESTLPIPQLISNYRQRSLYGFRLSTLIGWVGGDSFKTVYFFLQHSPLQFQVCAIFQLSIDVAIIAQRVMHWLWQRTREVIAVIITAFSCSLPSSHIHCDGEIQIRLVMV
ncbi:hypothetical protein BDZ97DRAFT_846782 [Flammula alnicola]|nr:hypothetical protein BDZ97DRAFT_846782 [Flammula alnicola]